MNSELKYKISLYAMAAFYIVAGSYHFINPAFYLSVMPEWMPAHNEANMVSGIVEILLGILLIPRATRMYASRTIVAMLFVFFFVIHIPMVFHFYFVDGMMFWIAVIRLPIQIALIAWALQFAARWKPLPPGPRDHTP